MTRSFQQSLKAALLASAFVIPLSLNAGAHAQSEQFGTADVGRIDRQLTEERIVPQLGPRVSVRETTLVNAPEGAENIKFNFGGLEINGANVFGPGELAPFYEDLIGTEISLAKVYAIANDITLKYRDEGYILTQVIVPAQTIDKGVARLQVVEGFIDRISVQGEEDNEDARNLIIAYASQISSGSALSAAEMERQLLLINDLPGINARSIISPSPTTRGAADLTIILERDPFEAGLGINNHGSRFLGRLQANGYAQFNSLFGKNDKITAQFVAAPDAGLELAYGSVGYEMPVGKMGTKAGFIASVTDTDPGFTLDQFDVKGLSRSLTAYASHPFKRSRNANVFGRLQFDWRNVESKNNVDPDTTRDRLRVLRASVEGDFLDRLLGVAVNSYTFQISQGIGIWGASHKNDDNLTRNNGDPSFTKANVQVSRLQRITNEVNLQVTGRAQLSNNPLLSSEEFGIGGMSTVRGFSPSEIVGEDGINGNAELRWNPQEYRDLELFSFLDSGSVWNQDQDGKRESLTSTGIGVRYDFPMDVAAEFVAAQPLHRDVDVYGDRKPRFFFSVNKKF